MNVTIKAAMDMAIRALQEKEQTEEVTQAIHRLQQLAKRDLVAQWSRESILEALENWRKAHDGQAPTVTALAEPGMPGCSIIQKHFGMRASAFLRQQYPQKVTPRHRPNRYGFTTEQDWLDCFREQFEKHCLDEGFSSKTYNVLRDKNTPLWATIAYNVGTSQWGELMKKAGVSYPNRQQNADPARMHMGVAHQPLLSCIWTFEMDYSISSGDGFGSLREPVGASWYSLCRVSSGTRLMWGSSWAFSSR